MSHSPERLGAARGQGAGKLQRMEAQLREAREEAGGRHGDARRSILDGEPPEKQQMESVEVFGWPC